MLLPSPTEPIHSNITSTLHQQSKMQPGVYAQPHPHPQMTHASGAGAGPGSGEVGKTKPGQWEQGLCGCGIGGCCLSFWCPCLVYGSNDQRLDALQSGRALPKSENGKFSPGGGLLGDQPDERRADQSSTRSSRGVQLGVPDLHGNQLRDWMFVRPRRRPAQVSSLEPERAPPRPSWLIAPRPRCARPSRPSSAARKHYQLRGNGCSDCLIVMCCLPCAQQQLSAELSAEETAIASRPPTIPAWESD